MTSTSPMKGAVKEKLSYYYYPAYLEVKASLGDDDSCVAIQFNYGTSIEDDLLLLCRDCDCRKSQNANAYRN